MFLKQAQVERQSKYLLAEGGGGGVGRGGGDGGLEQRRGLGFWEEFHI